MLNKKNNKNVGKSGEDLAAKFLINNGFEILDRNYNRRVGEIDIIAFKKGTIHFLEVKTVSRETFDLKKDQYYAPESNVTREKIKKIEKTSNLFLMEKGFTGGKVTQIDLITVFLIKSSKDKYFINYIPNINIF